MSPTDPHPVPSAAADVDVAILGSGFAGSLAALMLRRHGLRVILLERDRHPRFAIGESSTPLANLLVEEIARDYQLPWLASFSKWGSWQQHHPEIACGLKRGFTFHHHQPGTRRPDPSQSLFVAASPRDAIADTHWYRPDFDAFLAHEARQAGTELIESFQLETVDPGPATVALSGRSPEGALHIHARLVLDATGPRGALWRTLGLPSQAPPFMPETESVYAHFTGVTRFQPGPPARGEVIPYPSEDAAVHHVFPGGWIWILRFNNGITSAGAAIQTGSDLARTCQLSTGLDGWNTLLSHLPAVAALFEHATPVTPVHHTRPLGFQCTRSLGPRWALLPFAAGFVDPLLSAGFPLTLLGLQRLIPAVCEAVRTGDLLESAQDYPHATRRELEATSRLVGALHACMHMPAAFNALTRLYFAAASFSEAARRLNRNTLARGFLLNQHPSFFAGLDQSCTMARSCHSTQQLAPLLAKIKDVIQTFDVAGLTRADRHQCFPVDAADLHAAAHRLDATHPELEAMLQRTGFTPPTTTQP